MKTDGSFEQLAAERGRARRLEGMAEGKDSYIVTLWNDVPIAVTPPNFIILEVMETDPGIKGDTATGGTNRQKYRPARSSKCPSSYLLVTC